MPIIGKPLLILGSIVGVSLVGIGGYFGAYALDSQQTTLPNSGSETVQVEDLGRGTQDSTIPEGQVSSREGGQTSDQPSPAPAASPKSVQVDHQSSSGDTVNSAGAASGGGTSSHGSAGQSRASTNDSSGSQAVAGSDSEETRSQEK